MYQVPINQVFENKIEFYTLVTRFEEYNEMVDSAKKLGFDREDVKFYYFDNKNSNAFDGYSGLNHALKICKSEYMIFCHQDILFHYDDYGKLFDCINELENIDGNWAVAGNAGKNEKGEYFINITDPNGEQKIGNLPASVMSLDENFMIINMKHNIGCSQLLAGFHLYATDLCQNAINLGLNCYVIDFHLYHKSSGSLDKNFYVSIENYISMVKKRKTTQIIYTACTKFFVSNNIMLNKIFNISLFNKIYRFLNFLK